MLVRLIFNKSQTGGLASPDVTLRSPSLSLALLSGPVILYRILLSPATHDPFGHRIASLG